MKIPVFCSLIPAELIIHLGHEPAYIDGEMLTKDRPVEYHCAFHENLCSYSKSLYDYFLRKARGYGDDFGLIIVPTACDAMKKLYNALKTEIPEERLYILDIPKAKTEAAKGFLVAEFERLVMKLGDCVGDSGDCFVQAVRKWLWHGRHPRGNGDPAASPRNDMQRIGILGANVPLDIFRTVFQRFGMEPVFLNHCLYKAYADEELLSLLKMEGVEGYARGFLERNSCPRTDDNGYKEVLKRRIGEEGICGLIINTLKFCDFQPFDFRYFKKELGPDFPMLMIEHELTANYEGQTMTRIEAFFENLKRMVGFSTPCSERKGAKPAGKYFVGIDIGSHAAKLVCIDGDKNIISREVVPTGTSVGRSSEVLLERLRTVHGIERDGISRIVATGYGRNKVACADDVLTEISCHALGAHHTLGHSCTIIDIGGQDSKSIRVDENGGVVRFAMNDKCAAGTGRFLEVMAAKLEMSLGEFADLSFNAGKSVPISSMCSVFAESEVISLIASGSSREEISKGIHRAIAERTIALARRIEGEPPYYMAGGVARNKGLVKELEDCLATKLEIIDHPQFNGALGAALIALRGRDVV